MSREEWSASLCCSRDGAQLGAGSVFFFFSSRRRHTRWTGDLEFRRVLFRSGVGLPSCVAGSRSSYVIAFNAVLFALSAALPALMIGFLRHTMVARRLPSGFSLSKLEAMELDRKSVV